jgi:hypothetical protein
MSCRAEAENHGLGNRHTRWVKRPDIYRPPDEDLAAIAANAIECLTTIPTETIKVSARKGWLHLEGTVAWRDQRNTLEQVTRNLPGVHGVIDSIAVQSLPVQPHF